MTEKYKLVFSTLNHLFSSHFSYTAPRYTMTNNPSLSFFHLLLLLLIILERSCFSLCLGSEAITDGDGYTSCSSLFECGNVIADYPFWGGDRASGCGHPQLQLHCQDNLPTIDINQVTYRVLHINGDTMTLRMARNDYYVDGLCVSQYVNSTFDPSILELAYGFNNITIYYDCPISTDPYFLQPLTSCSANQFSNKDSSVYVEYPSPLGCSVRVVVPASKMWIYNISFAGLNQTLRDGFEMGVKVWDSAECKTCKSSGGKCGYGLESNNTPTCYCPNHNEVSTKCTSAIEAPQPSSPHTEFGNDEKGIRMTLRKIVLPVAVAGASMIILILLGTFWYFIQHRKIKQLDADEQNLSNSPMTTSAHSMYFGTHIFGYSELVKATNSFDTSKELGEGGYGTVYYGKLNDGREVAVKRLYERNFKSIEQYMNEVQILAHLRHPSLVMLHGCTSRHSRELLLVYEYVSNGTLADHLHGDKSNSSSFDWPLRLNIAIETADALAYLHSLDIIHRDVKTTNILLGAKYHVKVADFGLSRLFPTNATHVSTAPQGTPGYVDPEYHRCYQLTSKSDVYSFGVVLMELISSKKAVDTTRHSHDISLFSMAINRIQNGTLHELVDSKLGFLTDLSIQKKIKMASELAFLCLQQDKDLRPTMEEVVQGLKNIRNEGLSSTKHEMDIIDHENEIVPPPISPDWIEADKVGGFSS